MTEPCAIMKALGDRTRFQIVKHLMEHDYCVNALVKRLDATQSAVSQHLKILRDAGLVKGEKRGYYTHYRIEHDQLQKVTDTLMKLMNTKRKADHGSECKKS
ncbi:MAG: ArsR/SmtB family transcription factor [Bacillota bacterium]